MSRRGFVWSFVMILVIALAILLVLLPFLGKFFIQLGGEGPKEVCKSSVLANALLRIDRSQFSENIECKEEFITLTTRRESSIKAALADQMADCWEQFLEGRRQLFSNDARYCHICSHTIFKDKTLKVSGFDEYMFKTRVPQKDATYAVYLAPYLSGADVAAYVTTAPAARQSWGGGIIDTSKEYAAVFNYAKGRNYVEQFLKDAALIATFGWLGKPLLEIAFGLEDLGDLLPGAETLWYASVSLIEFTPQNLAALGCQELVRQRAE